MTRRQPWTVPFGAALLVAQAAAAPSSAVAVLPSGAEFGLELAVTDQERARGYMFREEVGPHEGMLFLFEASGHHSFWMKNCKVALDLVWLDEDFKVAHIAHDQEPCPEQGECPWILPLKSGRYVLEVAGGTARREKLQAGDRIVILSEGSLP